ncbi:hypothetical protein WA026_003441 [Henosepilachna vigintioctopunctata]|uniref:Large ribosomal subunit protein P2 n=1 Tax=Henosepilachna vigintioctopunctata TaxID=420089 RepID=A0AAW1TPM1_9CUCU
MRYVAAYLLSVLGGKASPAAADIEKILSRSSVGIESDTDKVERAMSELNGKFVDELIEQGRSKLASVPAGGAVGAAPVAASAPAAAEKKRRKRRKKNLNPNQKMKTRVLHFLIKLKLNIILVSVFNK